MVRYTDEEKVFRLIEVEHYLRHKRYHPKTKPRRENGLRKYARRFRIDGNGRFLAEVKQRKGGRILSTGYVEVIIDVEVKEFILNQIHHLNDKHYGQTKMLIKSKSN
jgi:hypothetical protein